MAIRIIKEQELIIGPLAWEEAKKVQGFHVIDQKNAEVSIDGNEKEVLEKLISQYSRLFGRASDEVCKEAVKDLIKEVPQDQLPSNLK